MAVVGLSVLSHMPTPQRILPLHVAGAEERHSILLTLSTLSIPPLFRSGPSSRGGFSSRASGRSSLLPSCEQGSALHSFWMIVVCISFSLHAEGQFGFLTCTIWGILHRLSIHPQRVILSPSHAQEFCVGFSHAGSKRNRGCHSGFSGAEAIHAQGCVPVGSIPVSVVCVCPLANCGRVCCLLWSAFVFSPVDARSLFSLPFADFVMLPWFHCAFRAVVFSLGFLPHSLVKFFLVYAGSLFSYPLQTMDCCHHSL